MKIPIAGPSYVMDALTFDCQRTINMYPILSEVGTSKEPSALRATAGLSLFCDLGQGPVRGGITASNGRAFFVAGNGLYEVFSNGTSTNQGTLNSFVGRVYLAENGTQVMIVDGTDGYIYNMDTDAFAEITDPQFPQPATVTFQDGYFIVNRVGTQEYYISAINDGTSWDAADFSTFEYGPDNTIAVISDNGNLWGLGETTIEAHQNTGAAAFPFERIGGAVIETGCAAAGTVCTFDNSIAWLGSDKQGRGVVWRANGYNAQRLSTQAIEAKIASVEDFSESYAYVYNEQGHVFYCLQIRGLDTTLVYDGATGMWHEKAYNNDLTGRTEQHRGTCHVFAFQKNLVGDRETGKIYQQSLSLYDDAGREIIRERVFPHIQDEKRYINYTSLELDLENGRGLVSGQGSDPQIMLQYSDDGGRTWSSELWRSMGAMGEYKTRVRWLRLGTARDRVFRVKTSDPIFQQINGAYLNA